MVFLSAQKLVIFKLIAISFLLGLVSLLPCTISTSMGIMGGRYQCGIVQQDLGYEIDYLKLTILVTFVSGLYFLALLLFYTIYKYFKNK